jgi:hypothetical protein
VISGRRKAFKIVSRYGPDHQFEGALAVLLLDRSSELGTFGDRGRPVVSSHRHAYGLGEEVQLGREHPVDRAL